MIPIKVKYHSDSAKPIQQAHSGEWADLRCAEDVNLKAGESKLISLGVSIEIPKGYEAILAPRSSTFLKYGIIMTNSIGVIDELYCGDDDLWMMSAFALRDCSIKAGERICQFRIQEKPQSYDFIEVASLNNSNRSGFGSTGSN